MEVFIVSFFGHRMIENALEIENRLEQLIRTLLREHEYVEFLVGRDGEFDQLVSSTIHRCKREYRSDNSVHIWVMPYVTAEYRDNEESFWDVCKTAAVGHYKNAHQTRNRTMVDKSDLVVFCIQHASGGAWQTMKYTKKQGKPCINLNEQLEEAE